MYPYQCAILNVDGLYSDASSHWRWLCSHKEDPSRVSSDSGHHSYKGMSSAHTVTVFSNHLHVFFSTLDVLCSVVGQLFMFQHTTDILLWLESWLRIVAVLQKLKTRYWLCCRSSLSREIIARERISQHGKLQAIIRNMMFWPQRPLQLLKTKPLTDPSLAADEGLLGWKVLFLICCLLLS